MVYPYDMIIQGKTGWAEASFVVDYAGRPLFTNASDASDPAFAKAAIAMIEANQFNPVKKDKRLTMAQSAQRFVFPGEAALDPEARRILAELRKSDPAICSQAELDQRPKALRQEAPVYPRAMKDDGLTGQAEIEFVVTAEGKVMFPRIVSATQEDFGWAAAAAVAQWRFEPPTRNGHKVDARLTVPVLFDARRLAAAD
jgi:TonB family protein